MFKILIGIIVICIMLWLTIKTVENDEWIRKNK